MDDISKRLGISKRTLYTVVDDKETLFLEVVDYVFVAIKESERKIIEDETLDIMEKITRLIIVLPEKYRTVNFRKIYELKEKSPKVFSKIEHKLETDWEPTFELLEMAMEKGKIRRINLPVFQTMISGTIEHFLSKNTLAENGIPYHQAMEEMIDLILNGAICKS